MMVAPAGEISTLRAMSVPGIAWSYSGVLKESEKSCSSLRGQVQASKLPASVPIRAARRPLALTYPVPRTGPVRVTSTRRHGNEIGARCRM
ncbi:hypothetical protein, partial [Candidatus Deferrimicrobium sp.]|uniref:hypothetical protein n=1 Tax=Candidatus Deferrimicrobium sp. TaxID=3060586 RepID=UPI002ED67019